MKKIILLLAILGTAFMSLKPEEPTLTVKLPIQGCEAVLQVIEQSNAPHTQVKAVQSELVKQLQAQIKQDSTKKK